MSNPKGKGPNPKGFRPKFQHNGTKNTKHKKPFNCWQKKSQKPGQNKPLNDDAEIKQLQSRYDSIDPANITSFSDLPLSRRTLKGLNKHNFTTPTAIQKQSIGHALQGKDVLGAAITGSGKTLAFLIPVLEQLYVRKWSRPDGVGAIIITPTRELAYQIFETLKKVGVGHDFSAGLIIGGQNLKFEKNRMDQCNIVICTPGRLLQHLDQNQVFNCSTMHLLVLDEADRCLDMGFQEEMNAIIEHLPPERQTFLFSATQTRSVKDLARLSLTDPVYVAPHEQAAFSTPDNLTQNYVVVNLEDKITMLWSFIKTHLKQKCIVFMSTCKQVKYVYEMFCKLRPGCSLLALYGSLHQARRKNIYDEFCRKSSVVLFATDVASRGLDFPTVNWVVQLDCPEDVTSYIHRAGRTARNAKYGECVLVLMPSEEEAMVELLKERKIPINQISIDTRKMFSPRLKMEGFLAQSQELKESAQRAFRTYIKSVSLMKNKKVFNVNALDTDAYALSLGLVVVPRIRFLDKMKKAKGITTTIKEEDKSSESESGSDSNSDDDVDSISEQSQENAKDDKLETSHQTDKNIKNKVTEPNSPSLKPSKNNFAISSDESDSDDDNSFMKIKRRDHEIPEDSLPVVPPLEEEKNRNKKPLTKAALAKRVIRKKITANTKTTFDEEGGTTVDTAKQLQSELAREYQMDAEGGINIERAKDLLREEDKFDKERFKQMVKARHKEAKKKSKSAGDQEQFDDFGSDEESEGPDMSWLPDPDKIYDKNKSNDDDEDDSSSDDYQINDDDVSDDETNFGRRRQGRQVVNSSDDSSEEEEEEEEAAAIHVPKKLVTKKRAGRRSTKADSDLDSNSDADEEMPVAKKAKKLTSKLSVNEAEQLAMQLLAGGS